MREIKFRAWNTETLSMRDWAEKGLDLKNTNPDVPYRCLQMIRDELIQFRQLNKRGK